jgi:hypothetical protein
MRGKAQKKKIIINKNFPLVECYPQLFLLGNFVLHRGKGVVPVIPKITEGVRGIK